MMNLSREQSSITVENSFLLCKDLNETQTSFITKNSGEKDFKELASLINKAVRDDKENISLLSTKPVDKSDSIIYNDDIWNGDKSGDDSKNFIESFHDMREKKKKNSKFAKELSGKNSQKMSKKPKHLIINTQPLKFLSTKEEDYNDDLEESLGSKKEEQVNPISNFETKNNNLNEIFISSSNTQQFYNDSFKFYTCPDDISQYRSSYMFNNYSFTPYHPPGINENFMMNYYNPGGFPVFPTIGGWESAYRDEFKEKDSTKEKEEFVQNGLQSQNSNLINPKQIVSTRNSTDSNESVPEINKPINFNVNPGSINPYARKYYTPTHKNVNYYTEHNLSKIKKQLDFQGIQSNTINNTAINNPTNSNKNFNKFNGGSVVAGASTPASVATNDSGNKIKSKITSSFCQNSIQPIQPLYPYTNVTTPNTNKTATYWENLIKSPAQIKLNLSDTKTRTNGVGNYNSNSSYNNSISSDARITQTKAEEVLDYKINLENILTGKDKRTTIMIRNIPNKYTLPNLVEEVNATFVGKYDYINLPVDYERKLNLGYAFINFVDTFHIVLFYETFFYKKWTKYRSDKKIDLNYAEKQGKKDITCKDENTYFAMEDNKINSKKTIPKIEIPIKFLDLFKKIYPNAVCVSDSKNSVTSDKTFYVKTLSKRL